MNSITVFLRALALTLVVAIFAAALPGAPAFAQDEVVSITDDAEESADSGEAIVVTGSRIQRRETDTAAPVAVVPAAAVRRGPSGDIVFVAVEDERDGSLRAAARVVKTGGTDGSMTRVLEGLSEGEQIVTDGSFKVFEGSLLAGQGVTTP